MGQGRIVIGIPLLLVGGTEVQTLNLVETLVTAGYRVTVCCYYEHDSRMVSAMKGAGARIALLGLARSQGNWHLLKKLRRFFGEEAPELVHIQYISPGLVPIMAARWARVPRVVATVHQPGRTYGVKERGLLRMAATLCDTFFCNTLAVERSWFGSCALFEPGGRNQGHCTIYNAVDAERIGSVVAAADRHFLREEIGVRHGSAVGVVGRLRWEKGQRILIEAMVEVVRQQPFAQLIVIGDGPDRAELEALAERMNLGANVLWLGQQEPEAVQRLYAALDLVVVPSFFEGFGLVAAEAMAAGLPVIASRVDGLVEVVDHGTTGLLVSPGDAAELAKAILYLLNNDRFRQQCSINAVERVKRSFSRGRFAEMTLTAHKQVLYDR